MRMIGRDPDGNPLPPADAGEEERLATADLRGALREAQLARSEIALRGVDQKEALARGQQHLENARGELRDLERHVAAAERDAAERLADSFRGSEKLLASDERLSPPATSEIEAARTAVQRAQNVVATLTAEVETTLRELGRAQHVVDRAVADVVRQKLLDIAQQIDEHDRRSAELRASMHAAGYATANVQRRPGWQGVRVFTSTMIRILHRQALDGSRRNRRRTMSQVVHSRQARPGGRGRARIKKLPGTDPRAAKGKGDIKPIAGAQAYVLPREPRNMVDLDTQRHKIEIRDLPEG
jgi:hypothetical protein